MKLVVFDVETDSLFTGDQEHRATQLRHEMQVTVACAQRCVLHTADASVCSSPITCWRDNNTSTLGPFEDLFAAFDDADVIVAYNGAAFDMPVMRKYYGTKNGGVLRHQRHQAKLFDVFSRIRDATGVWMPLDQVLSANGLQTKSSDGVEAVRMWEQQQREQLEAYCMRDVELLQQLVLLDTDIKLPGVMCQLPHWQYSMRTAASMRMLSARTVCNITGHGGAGGCSLGGSQ